MLAALAMVYSVIAWLAVRKPIRSAGGSWEKPLPVTILKPLCGAERIVGRLLQTISVRRIKRRMVISQEVIK